ncbi:terminase small subunit [bacterium]|nr:terminase small subunit [bacterium]
MYSHENNVPGSQLLDNLKQERFCQEYVLTKNGTQAAIKAGYTKKTAAQTASRMLTYVKVSERIQYLRNHEAKRLHLRKDRVLRELADIAFANIGDCIKIENTKVSKTDPVSGAVEEKCAQRILIEEIPDDLLPAIKSIKQNRDGLAVTMHDKLRAIEIMCKIMGWMDGDPESAPDFIPTSLEERRKFLESLPKAVDVKPQGNDLFEN